MNKFMGLRLRKKSGCNGHVDGYPCSDIQSSIVVSRERESTDATNKVVPCRTVGFGDMMTRATFLRSIGWIN
jgi:hypothetical protein